MVFPSVLVIKFFQFFLLSISEIFFELVDVVPVFEEISGILNSQILALIDFDMAIPLFQSPLFLFLFFIKFCICLHFGFVVLLLNLFLLNLSLFFNLLKIFFIFHLL